MISKTAPSLPLICSEWFCQLAIALNCYRPASSCKIFAKTLLDPQSKWDTVQSTTGGLDNTHHIICLHILLFPIFNVPLTFGSQEICSMLNLACDKMCEVSEMFRYRLDSGSVILTDDGTHFGIDVGPF